MANALSVVKAAYDAFGRGDIAAILDLVADNGSRRHPLHGTAQHQG